MSASENELKPIILPPGITVRDLSERLNASPIDVIKTLMSNGVMANINQQIDFDTAAIVAAELGFEAIPRILRYFRRRYFGGNSPLATNYCQGKQAKSLTPTASCNDLGSC